MLDHLNNLSTESSILLIAITCILTGLVGGLHCVSMCGPICISVNKDKKQIFLYQLGRLFSYMSIVVLCGGVFSLFKYEANSKPLVLISSIGLEIILLILGFNLFLNKKIHIKLPLFINNKIINMSKKFYILKGPNLKSFAIGLISVFLPCGLFYGVLIALLAITGPSGALVGVVSFWIGTLPAMVFSPIFIQKLIAPLTNRFPKFSGGLVIVLAITMLTNRFMELYFSSTSCH